METAAGGGQAGRRGHAPANSVHGCRASTGARVQRGHVAVATSTGISPRLSEESSLGSHKLEWQWLDAAVGCRQKESGRHDGAWYTTRGTMGEGREGWEGRTAGVSEGAPKRGVTVGEKTAMQQTKAGLLFRERTRTLCWLRGSGSRTRRAGSECSGGRGEELSALCGGLDTQQRPHKWRRSSNAIARKAECRVQSAERRGRPSAAPADPSSGGAWPWGGVCDRPAGGGR